MKEFNITDNLDGLTIENVILKKFPNISSGTLNKLFRVKDIKLDGTRVKKGTIVNTGEEVKVYIKDELLTNLRKIEYFYEDENILVAYKPKGIVSCKNTSESNSFDNMVKQDKKYPYLAICHRLDTNTEGLVIFAKSIDAEKELLKGFKNSYIHKEYLVLVYGKMEKPTEKLSAFLLKDTLTSFCKVTYKNTKGALPICTEYEVIRYLEQYNVSLLNIKLHTGRTHQIRAHMKFLGHNVIGDSKYGLNDINRKLGFKSQVLLANRYGFSFPDDSTLKYLNNINIELQDSKIDTILEWLDK